MLDLPKATRSASEIEGEDGASSEPSTKKARTGSGLSALLPEPKKPAGLGGLKLPDPKTAGGVQQSSTPSIGLVPHVLKGKTKAVEKPEQATESSSKPEAVVPAPSEEEIQDGEADSAVLDFFGLGE